MSIGSEVGLTIGRELRRNLRSPKGLAMLALFLLGGAGGSLGYLQFTQFAVNKLTDGREIPPDMMRELKLKLLMEGYPEAMARYLVDCPSVLLFLFRASLWAIPMLTLLSGFDMIAGETQHRTMRYMVGRATRPAIVVGKVLGLWAMVSLMALALNVVVWVIALVHKDGTASEVASWGLRWWALSLPAIGCYAGMTGLVSALFRTPTLALFVGIAGGMSMLVLRAVLGVIKQTQQAAYLFPGSYDGMLISNNPSELFGALGVLLAWAAATTFAACELVRRRDA